MATNFQNSFTVVSTFSGAGGSSLGYQLAGGKVLLAVEWDDNAVATYRLNFPDTPIYHGDIVKLSVDECCEKAGIKPGELDILDGSPPCQGFSTAGKRKFDDDRNQLFREFVRLLQGLQPRVFVMENVSGMVKGKMKLIFAECLRELKASGYRVKARVLNAMYFNVPQSRQRLIFVGVREDLGVEPGHPKAVGRPITVKECLAECPDGYAPIIKAGRFLSRLMQLKVGQRHGEVYGSSFQKVRVNPHRVSPAITKANMMGHAELYHWSKPRPLTDRELARLATFGDAFRFAGTYREIVNCIGNSVPPNFMKCIAEYIRDNILGLTPRLEP